jgi:microcystin-dependent protein
MATVTPGITFVSGETVTPAKLNNAATPTVVVTDGEVTTAKIADGAVTQSKLNSSVTLVPVGAVMPFATSAAPTGWLVANGDAVPNGSGTVQGVTADFSALYAALSTSFGSAGTLPDLRGIFVRGSGSQTIGGTAYSGTFAESQSDENKAHRHFIANTDTSNATADVGATTYTQKSMITPTANTREYTLRGSSTEPTLGLTSEEGGESRPANISLLYCIKY